MSVKIIREVPGDGFMKTAEVCNTFYTLKGTSKRIVVDGLLFYLPKSESLSLETASCDLCLHIYAYNVEIFFENYLSL
jgi:hypothetical protein